MRKVKYKDSIREAMMEEMAKDTNIVLVGEDIAKGYKGCFGVTKGICETFGEKRIIDMPICEASVIGCALGASQLGIKVIAEIMFEDFITVCFDGIVNQAAKLKTLSGGQYNSTIVIRTPGGSAGFGAQHSQCLESIFMHVPGLYIALPSNAYDAKGLMKTAINFGEPVLFFEHQKLYNTESDIPDEDYSIPFGSANIINEGKDVTVVAFSYMALLAMDACRDLESDYGVSIELIDPRTLVPLDFDTIAKSVKKTGRLVTVEEGVLRGGAGSEIVARVEEECFDFLDAPAKRIAALNFPVPISPLMEKAVVPNKDRIIKEISEYLGLK